MIWSVSDRPVMKTTGTWAQAGVSLSRRHSVKPSMPGMTASSSTPSGTVRAKRCSASSASRAASTT
ncbi:hypothetical protein GY14_01530 [Delftia tsuruhatensis]|nr:hypothetical protein GY14_01530 [Delftia tsuruhatensis]